MSIVRSVSELKLSGLQWRKLRAHKRQRRCEKSFAESLDASGCSCVLAQRIRLEFPYSNAILGMEIRNGGQP